MKNISIFTIIGWLVTFGALLAFSWLWRDAYGFLIVLAGGSALITLYRNMEVLRINQENIKERLEEIYEIAKGNDKRPESSANATRFVRCVDCNNRYEQDLTTCPFC